MKFLLMIVAFVCLSLAAEIVRETTDAVVFRQADGVEVTLRKHPQKTVIGYLSFAPVWDQAGGKAVGIVDNKADEAVPESMRDLPKIGTGMTPELEKVMLLEPDLVLLSDKITRHQAAAKQLRAAGVTVLSLTYNNFDDYRQILDLFCRLNGDAGADDFAPAKATLSQVAAICEKAKPQPPVRFAAIFVTANGISLESDESNAGKIMEKLNGVNVRPPGGPLRLPFSMEQLLLDDPDLIVIITMGEAAALRGKVKHELLDQTAWLELTAAKQGRVHFVDPGLFLFLSGPRFPEAFRTMDQLMHPGDSEK